VHATKRNNSSFPLSGERIMVDGGVEIRIGSKEQPHSTTITNSETLEDGTTVYKSVERTLNPDGTIQERMKTWSAPPPNVDSSAAEPSQPMDVRDGHTEKLGHPNTKPPVLVPFSQPPRKVGQDVHPLQPLAETHTTLSPNQNEIVPTERELARMQTIDDDSDEGSDSRPPLRISANRGRSDIKRPSLLKSRTKSKSEEVRDWIMESIRGTWWDVDLESKSSFDKNKEIPPLATIDSRQTSNGRNLHDPVTLTEVTEADERKRKSKSRQKWIQTMCQPRLCMAAVVVVAVLVGVAVAVTIVVQKKTDTPTNPESEETKIQGKAIKGIETHGIKADLKNICTKKNVQSWDGYKACRNLCEQAYCCFLPHWDAWSCCKLKKSWCQDFANYCFILNISNVTTFDIQCEEGAKIDTMAEQEGETIETMAEDVPTMHTLSLGNKGTSSQDQWEREDKRPEIQEGDQRRNEHHFGQMSKNEPLNV